MDMRAFEAMLREAHGWNGLEGDSSQARERAEAAVRLEAEQRRTRRRMLRAAFGTPDGRAALELLRRMTIERPATQAELDERDPLAFALGQARRQGAAQLIFMLEAEINANDEDDDAPA